MMPPRADERNGFGCSDMAAAITPDARFRHLFAAGAAASGAELGAF
jgi:hypothetical protein